ncbi:hypothetical protein C5C74_09495 [Rathayibacter sp. AY1E8]|uniref:hypothetical protein n=1 Tax=unclassified Rathayibacter TaxID=2609250 RepID=UPI000CE86039|nr:MULTISPECIES: hypothetical protein [unclassified Rathayibacter]PPG17965.1 hypothetical protein C5C74_09495 [Rathayibacter sp. AY1E8]PPI01193.1 hypothetical protein C5C95_03390 [Rathayibacter sp. AY1B7]
MSALKRILRPLYADILPRRTSRSAAAVTPLALEVCRAAGSDVAVVAALGGLTEAAPVDPALVHHVFAVAEVLAPLAGLVPEVAEAVRPMVLSVEEVREGRRLSADERSSLRTRTTTRVRYLLVELLREDHSLLRSVGSARTRLRAAVLEQVRTGTGVAQARASGRRRMNDWRSSAPVNREYFQVLCDEFLRDRKSEARLLEFARRNIGAADAGLAADAVNDALLRLAQNTPESDADARRRAVYGETARAAWKLAAAGSGLPLSSGYLGYESPVEIRAAEASPIGERAITAVEERLTAMSRLKRALEVAGDSLEHTPPILAALEAFGLRVAELAQPDPESDARTDPRLVLTAMRDAAAAAGCSRAEATSAAEKVFAELRRHLVAP